LFNALDGLIQMANPSDKIIGSHCVLLVGYDDDKGTFTIRNSWGTSWGDKGYGYLPYEFIERFFVECWIALPHEDKPMSLEGEGVITWGIPSFLHSCVHGVEIRGGVGDDYRAWAFAVPYEGFLNVEELFVLPAHRGKGLSNYLFENLERLSEGLSIPLRYWVPFADSTDSNLRIVRHLATTYKYKISPSSVRWASHIMSREVPKGGNKRAFPRPGVIPPDASRLPILAAPFFNFPF
jgi:GNAT superfamily N-acetyltransferase